MNLSLGSVIGLLLVLATDSETYLSGAAVQTPTVNATLGGETAKISATVQKVSTPPPNALQFNSPEQDLKDLEEAVADYENFQTGQPVTTDPIVFNVPQGSFTTIVFKFQKVQAGAAAPAQQPSAIRSALH